MTTHEKEIELRDKILKGLEKTYENVIEFKKQKNSEMVVMRGNKIMRLKPEEIEREREMQRKRDNTYHTYLRNFINYL